MPTFQEYRLQARLSLSKLAREADVDYKTAKRADEGEPIQRIKAIALIDVLSKTLGQTLNIDSIEGLEVTY